MADMNIVEEVVKPAMEKVFEGDGIYRCERDLHHHLTNLFSSSIGLGIGGRKRILEYEHPTKAKYNWQDHGSESRKSGNVDLYFFSNDGEPPHETRQKGVAIEVNVNYPDIKKIKQDIIKLIAKENDFEYGLYVASSCQSNFHESIAQGVKEAYDWFLESDPGFLLPKGFGIFAFEFLGGKKRFYNFMLDKACHINDLEKFFKLKHERNTIHLTKNADEGSPAISREEAENYYAQELDRVGVRKDSVTARCMFNETTNSKGENLCLFGRTPLWGNELLPITEDACEYVQREMYYELVRKISARWEH